MRKFGGLHKRWLLNTVVVVFALGLVCVLAVTAFFAAYYYNSIQSDMYNRAESTVNFFTDYLSLNYNDFYQSCITYAQTFEDRDIIELQFINTKGQIVASSYGQWPGDAPVTPEIALAVSTRGIQPFLGRDTGTGERILAMSAPMIYSNGEVIGVLRFVTSTRLLDFQISIVVLVSLVMLAVVVGVMFISSTYYINSILVPITAITEKAKRIAGGTYGIQIESKYDDEIGELVDTINEMSTQISQNEKLQTEFISSLSHELRTPLTAITGWSETLLESDQLDPETRRGMRIILRETRRLTEMVVSLLSFTKLQDGRMTLNMEVADLRAELEDIVYMYGSRLAQDGITLNYLDNDDEISEITCDPERLRQVFLNILDNAAKHGHDGRKIDCSIHEERGFVVVRIRDYGPGIPEDEIPLVKKKFYKGSSKARGSGIGLAVCDEIIAMHQGTLTLENASGGGTLVTVRLPAAQ